MISSIIEFSGRHRALVFLVTAVLAAAGWYSMRTIPVDAIPDLSETQVIVYSRWDRSPDIMEDQVSYPIVTSMLSTPGVRTVRGFSDFGYSYVHIIFKEGTDIHWARSRTLEYLSAVLPKLPKGVQTEVGPDATGVGWVFQYALIDDSGTHSLAELRSVEDWYLRFHLQAVPGVAEVAPLGGFVRQYQVNVDPGRLRAYNIPVTRVVESVRAGNNDVGGRLLEMGGAEYMVRGRGYVRSADDIGNIVLNNPENGTPVRVRDVAHVELGPDLRRGVADWNGRGDTVSGIVVMRQGENALAVIDRVKEKLKELEPGLPKGVRIVTAYDRSDLILRSIDNLKGTLLEEMLIVSVVIFLFLWHAPSSVVPVVTIPVAILISFIPMKLLGVTANIMSLGGIAVAIGAMVDAAIVVVEQTHKKLEEWNRTGRHEDYRRVVIDAVKEVGPPSFFALLVIAVSFVPVLTLEAQEGRLFRPLAYTKNLSMIVAAVLAITLDPAMRLAFTRTTNFKLKPGWVARGVNAVLVGKIHAEEDHPLSKILIRLYQPVATWALRCKWLVLAGAVALLAVTVPVYQKLGSEFMPPLDEGALLYMPTTVPGISETEAQRLLQAQDRILKRFPEVESVLGKAGRAETATDPAPISMFETVIVLKPRGQWRHVATWYSDWAPDWVVPLFRHITADRISTDDLIEEMNQALRVPGVSNAWTMPIKNRIDMLTTGIRTPVGVKIYGADLREIERLGVEMEQLLQTVPGTRSAYAERTGTGYFLDVDWKREELARYGVTIDDAQTVVTNAIGGENVTTTVEGRERYVGGYVAEAKHLLQSRLHLPQGYAIAWSGQYEAMQRVRQRLTIILPVTLLMILALLYMNTRSAVKTAIIVLAVPFSAVGAVWLLYALGYNMSIGVWVGLIALLGVDAETGVFMLLYLDLAFQKARSEGRLRSQEDLRQAILEGAVKRIRPKFMTVATMFLGLVPILWSTGTGADVMKRIAAPLVGGIFTSFLLELVVYPAIYEVWKWHFEIKHESAS